MTEERYGEEMEELVIFRCEDSLEGILTAVYDGFVYKKAMDAPYQDTISIAIGAEGNLTLFSREIEVETSLDKAEKTLYAIKKKLGFQICEQVLAALCHDREDRGTIVFGYLTRAFRVGQRIDEHLTDIYVQQCLELARKVYNEQDKWNGFVRFTDIGEVLFAEIEPKCNMIPMLMDHFADRYHSENFIIYDNRRKYAYVHQANGLGRFVTGTDLHGYQGNGDTFEQLWKQYFQVMAIEERRNERCQNNHVPKWYRRNMLEFV